MNGRFQAIALVMLSVTSAFFSWLGAAVVGLVTLRKGVGEGGIVGGGVTGGGGLGHRSAASSVAPEQPALAVDEMRVVMTESSIAAAPDSAELANATKPRSTPKPSHVIM